MVGPYHVNYLDGDNDNYYKGAWIILTLQIASITTLYLISSFSSLVLIFITNPLPPTMPFNGGVNILIKVLRNA